MQNSKKKRAKSKTPVNPHSFLNFSNTLIFFNFNPISFVAFLLKLFPHYSKQFNSKPAGQPRTNQFTVHTPTNHSHDPNSTMHRRAPTRPSKSKSAVSLTKIPNKTRKASQPRRSIRTRSSLAPKTSLHLIPPQNIALSSPVRTPILTKPFAKFSTASSEEPSCGQSPQNLLQGLSLTAGLQRTKAIDPMDGSLNTNPGYSSSEKHPEAKHLVSPHLRQFIHEMPDEQPAPAKKAPIQPENLATGYRYLLRHLKYVKDPKRSDSLKTQFRSDFEMLMKCATISEAEVAFDRSIPNLWSQLSVVRMGISKLRRPKIPQDLKLVAEYLGIQEGFGFFCAVRSDDDRFKTATGDAKAAIITDSRGTEMLNKAKLYNMDLHPADVQRHYDLVERYHFNGKERWRG